ncbi:MAG: SDR family NAD(P)-dependent oxidoreductase [Nocardioides sp.]|jgi:NAD(P)-dependent dehydrogenase (short-subunit alcohol dehydrogenase family)
MNERTSLITGGTGGIGRAVANRLASGGDRVLVVGRNEERGHQVVSRLPRPHPHQQHDYVPADLSLLGDTARLSDAVAARTERLDSVVLSAGVFAGAPEWTSEGLERSFVLNYLSRFLLIERLLPLLEAAKRPRLVLVANAGRYRDTLDLDAIGPGRAHRRRHLAAASQFANDLLAVELSDRLQDTGIEVTCVYPGVVRTDVFRNARGVPRPLRRLAMMVQRVVGADPDDAADTPAFLAQDPTAWEVNGRFYGPGRRQLEVPDRAARPARRTALWEASEALVAQWMSSPPGEAGIAVPVS